MFPGTTVLGRVMAMDKTNDGGKITLCRNLLRTITAGATVGVEVGLAVGTNVGAGGAAFDTIAAICLSCPFALTTMDPEPITIAYTMYVTLVPATFGVSRKLIVTGVNNPSALKVMVCRPYVVLPRFTPLAKIVNTPVAVAATVGQTFRLTVNSTVSVVEAGMTETRSPIVIQALPAMVIAVSEITLAVVVPGTANRLIWAMSLLDLHTVNPRP